MREIRTYSLSGGRWPARKRDTSGPTIPQLSINGIQVNSGHHNKDSYRNV
jgi:hypothetical protein